MKEVALLIVVCLTLVKAQAQNSYNIILFTEQGERFWAVLNGVRQNEDPETNVKITGLNANLYKVKVIFEDKNLGEMDKNLYLPEHAAEVTYVIKKNKKGEYAPRYMGDVPLAQAPAPTPDQHTIVYSSAPKPAVSQTVTVTEQTRSVHGNPDDVNVAVDMNVAGFDMGMNVAINDPLTTNAHSHTTTTTTTTSYTSTTTTSDAGVYEATEPAFVLPGYSGPVGCPMPMAPGEFESAKASIVTKTFEDSKLTIAKQITDSNCLLASQVRQIMALFTFEGTKLEYAKQAYYRTYDLGNYYKVNDAFEFESTIDELNHYINSNR